MATMPSASLVSTNSSNLTSASNMTSNEVIPNPNDSSLSLAVQTVEKKVRNLEKRKVSINRCFVCWLHNTFCRINDLFVIENLRACLRFLRFHLQNLYLYSLKRFGQWIEYDSFPNRYDEKLVTPTISKTLSHV